MGRNKNNALILTSIKGERGPQGFPGPDGQACYTGTGDPNTLTFTLPDYSNDPVGFDRNYPETLYYQDTVTGQVWTAPYRGAIRIKWTEQTSLSTKGETGDRGATATDKYDVNFMTAGNPLILRSDLNAIPTGTGLTEYTLTEIGKIYFQGTNITPDISDVKAIASVSGSRGIAIIIIEDSSRGIVGTLTISSSNLEINTASLTGLPTTPDIFTIKTYLIDFDSTDTETIITQIAYLSLS